MRLKTIKSFRCAIEGICSGIKTQHNMKIHFAAAALVLIFGVLLNISKIEWIICIMLIFMVMAGELFNTAVEAVVDMVMPDFHPKAKLAKDTAAGGVLMLAIGAAIVGLIIFVPEIMKYL